MSAHFRVNKTITVIEGSFSSNLQMALTISICSSIYLCYGGRPTKNDPQQKLFK
jgi:hypothetical protein